MSPSLKSLNRTLFPPALDQLVRHYMSDDRWNRSHHRERSRQEMRQLADAADSVEVFRDSMWNARKLGIVFEVHVALRASPDVPDEVVGDLHKLRWALHHYW